MAGKWVLVVDDEMSVRAVLTNVLRYLGHDSETACDANEALAKIEATEFHIVLTDFDMPGMKGDELAREIKRRKQGVPVVLITGGGAPNCSECFDGVLMKPFSKADLGNMIDLLT